MELGETHSVYYLVMYSKNKGDDKWFVYLLLITQMELLGAVKDKRLQEVVLAINSQIDHDFISYCIREVSCG